MFVDKFKNLLGISGVVAALALLCCTLLYIGVKICYTPYELARLENYRKENYIKEQLCDNNVISNEFQLNAVTYDGRTSNCSQANIFTSTSIFIGTLLDMWEDSLPRYVIYGGNWKIQALFMASFIIMTVILSKKVAEMAVSLPLMFKLLNSETHNNFLSTPLKEQSSGRRPIAVITKSTQSPLLVKKDKVASH
jgi:hypothetical protein